MPIINSKKTLFLLCDVQKLFEPKIYQMPGLINSIRFLLKSMQTLEIPILATEHYPKAFGNTVDLLQNDLPKQQNEQFTLIEKRVFSMMIPETINFILNNHEDKDTFILSGIESHVCILQTTLDLLSKGKKVYIVTDATSSQRFMDRKYALKRLQQEGAILTTSESVVYELMQTSLHEKFKEILGHIKQRNAGPFMDAQLQYQ